MLKLLGCSMILGGTTAVGFLYGETFKKRVQQLNELERVIMQLQNEITYVYTPLPEAFMKIAQKSREPVNHILEDASEFLISNNVDNVYEAFKKALIKNRDKLYLNEDDINILLDLTKNIGESDVYSQSNIFNLTLTNIKKQIKGAELIKNKNLKMYRYLGFSLGAVLVIILL